MSPSTSTQDLAWRNRIVLVVEVPSTKQTQKAQYVPVDLVRNGVTYIILYSMFATLLFVLLCAVLFKNGLSPQKRRLPFVWVLGLALLGGLLGSTLNTVFWAYQLFGNVSNDTMFRLWMSSTAVLYIVPLITHFAIQLRLLSFYPPTLASRSKRIVISILPTLMKVARLTTISITLHNSFVAYQADGFGDTVSQAANDTSNLFTLIFQLVDTVYASAFLLWHYWHLGHRDNELMRKKSHPAVRWSKQFMFAIAFGYVLPTIYALALVLTRALSLSPVDMGFMLVANVYVQAFGAVLASLSSAYKWREDRFTDELAPDNVVVPGMRDVSHSFAASTASRCGSRHAPVLESLMPESNTPSRPKFTTSRLPPLDSRQHGVNNTYRTAAEHNACQPGFGAIITDGIGVTNATTGIAGDLSPKSSARHAQENDKSPNAQYLSSTDGISMDFPAAYAVQKYESRRSSDATLSGPYGGMGDKFDRKACPSLLDGNLGTGATAQSRPGSRPGSSGAGRIHRMGSSRSVPRDGSLQEVEESKALSSNQSKEV
ncbi:uncharacterized protein MEPE_00207 [Melanopsichium pennsylvanicum]|uniref:Uncharacterized protein n=2 Tax=Melanopsichium pennsylvanicum TaxID=63383 RepID=A0AAJ4XFP8_9BASI|nr:putative protein [Melanopsichium pennsylvanicum 4]SNX81502.1 uncharacterized protein MEPE_00207 [Melanopsichium pennsylvanicum]